MFLKKHCHGLFTSAVVAAIALLPACSNDAQGQDGVQAADLVARRKNRALGTPFVRKSESEALKDFEKSLPEDPTKLARVLVHFEGLVPFDTNGRAVGAKTAEERVKRTQLISKAQAGFQQRILQADHRLMRRFKTLPFFEVMLKRADMGNVRSWIESVPAMSTERPFRLRFELESGLLPQAHAATACADIPIADVCQRLEWAPAQHTGDSPVVAVIDDGVESLLQFQGRIAGQRAYVDGMPALTSAPPLSRPSGISHGSEVALVVAASDPWPSILALDCGDGTRIVPWGNVLAALDDIDYQWADTLGKRLRVVSMSLGDPDCITESACACNLETAAALAISVANLAERDILLVLPAGNAGHEYVSGVIFPNCVLEPVCVGATYGDGSGACDQSCWSTRLDLCAPGWDVYIAYDNGSGPSGSTMGPGTSIAVPFVAGALARLSGERPTRSMGDIVSALISGGNPVAPNATQRLPSPPFVSEIRVAKAAALLDGTD